jgi:plastocyanin
MRVGRSSITIPGATATAIGLAAAIVGCLYPPIPERYVDDVVTDGAAEVMDAADDVGSKRDDGVLDADDGARGADDASDVSDARDVDPLASVPILNSCRRDDYVDLRDDGALRVVSFGGAGTSAMFAYSPRCILVAAHQTVSFRGEFANHPMSPGIGPGDTTAGSPDNPIPPTSSGTQLDVRFDAPGSYPYFCMLHVSSGMAGVVTAY